MKNIDQRQYAALSMVIRNDIYITLFFLGPWGTCSDESGQKVNKTLAEIQKALHFHALFSVSYSISKHLQTHARLVAFSDALDSPK